MKINELAERLFLFAVSVIKFIKKNENTPEFKIIKYQLTKAATSSGANYEESQAGSSTADFSNKVKISLKEMRESNYWLRLIKYSELCLENHKDELENLIAESEELKKILGAIVVKINKNFIK